MKKMNKKGFTIVELVIVIAVIAILAAVLIPTYSSLVKKANLSADEQAVRQMNTALAIYTAENGKPTSDIQVKNALDENLINTESMTPVTQGYAFYWNPDKNEIVLVGEGKATAKNTWFLLSSTGYGTKTLATTEEQLTSAISNSSVSSPALITLQSDITLTSDISVGNANCVILDINNKKLDIGRVNSGKGIIISGGSLTVKNGNIEADYEAFRNESGTLYLNSVNITSKNEDNWATVKITGISDTTIIGCTIKTKDMYAIGGNAETTENYGARITIIDSSITSEYVGNGGVAIFMPTASTITIDGSTFEGYSYGGYFRGCNASITNSTFKHNAAAETTDWTSGPTGIPADLLLSAGQPKTNYASNASFVCNGVTGNAIVHQPDGSRVTVSGIEAEVYTGVNTWTKVDK